MPNLSFDPLDALRGPDAPEFDVFLHGTVFLDMIFAGMPAPVPGTEVWAEGMASCPGGIANLAVAARRLGLRTSLAAAFGDDDYGDFCWRTLQEQERVDLGHSRRFEGWHSPVTVSMAYGGDRTMVSHGHPAPVPAHELIGTPPSAAAVFADLSDAASFDDGHWVDVATRAGALAFADVGWDAEGRWAPDVLDRLDRCHAFMPNEVEAIAYTGRGTARDALYGLADRVPLAVVTLGADGSIGIDSSTGEEAAVPALRVTGIDPTGSGDVFAAAMVVGTLAGWPLEERMSFAGLCSALALQEFGGSLAAPGWGDVIDWWNGVRAHGGEDSYHRSLQRRYAFLDDLAPDVPVTACRRATATIARRADLPT